ncbi:MAG TPA: hypothetical protein PLF32_04980 [Bacteroidales bacterium]|jgi:enoyl-[acyl-carrier-protein] reductase (NADH)|nr:hypothetical protein [Bacteroidales bacterium]HOF16864.1 hypothetical protein [Bacteroidales bacterium]HON20850.1 hypothetical protein [Bacteroidales bacterium]HOR81987.1 hypothetical protein [Bacteroidales bacterium]HPJ91510.1 hypothetical protein [Bacteroidales bacterium]
MEILLNILMVTIPAVVVAITAYFAIKLTYDKELKKQVLELKHNSTKVITPIRLQSYERIALFLERIKPESILLRNITHSLNAAQYQNVLLTSIRNEFEHNLSQQVYISSALWEVTKKAKEETIKIINLAAGQLNPEATGKELANKIIELAVDVNPQPSDVALDVLRKEIKEFF